MQKYQTVSQLSSIEFRRLTGVQKTTFIEMVAIVKEPENKTSGRGKPFHLSEERRFMKGRELLIGIVSMLIKMAQKQR